MILLVALALVVAGVVGCAVRVPRGVAIGLMSASALPVLVGLLGQMRMRSATDEVLASLGPAATPADRELGYTEADRCLWLGIGAMLACDGVAVFALIRSMRGPPQPGL